MKKRLLMFILTASLLFGFAQKVCASGSTDINTYTIDVKADVGTVSSSLKIKVNGKFEENTLYYAKFVNDGDSKPTDIPNNWNNEIDSDRNDIKNGKVYCHHHKLEMPK